MGATEKEFLNELTALAYVEHVFQSSTADAPYRLGDAFPQLRGLVVRHRRWYAENSYQTQRIIGNGRLIVSPGLKTVAADLVREWDETLHRYPVDAALLSEEIIRYAARQLLSRFVLRKSLGLPLPVMNALQDIVWQWFSRPVTGTLVDEYFSERGATLRKHVCDPLTGSHFRMQLLDEIDREARSMLDRDTLMACHLGGPDTKVFDTSEEIRPVLVWHGIRAQRGSTGLGEYPQILCEWFAQQDEQRKQHIVSPAVPGGKVVPICVSPGLDQQQWETAIALWDDSFQNDDDDPGPYRNQEAAIFAAANL